VRAKAAGRSWKGRPAKTKQALHPPKQRPIVISDFQRPKEIMDPSTLTNNRDTSIRIMRESFAGDSSAMAHAEVSSGGAQSVLSS
jgi:hypothetical protein